LGQQANPLGIGELGQAEAELSPYAPLEGGRPVSRRVPFFQ